MQTAPDLRRERQERAFSGPPERPTLSTLDLQLWLPDLSHTLTHTTLTHKEKSRFQRAEAWLVAWLIGRVGPIQRLRRSSGISNRLLGAGRLPSVLTW